VRFGVGLGRWGAGAPPRRICHPSIRSKMSPIYPLDSLNKSLGCALPASLLFDYPTLEKIARYLLKDVAKLEAEAAPSPASAAALMDELDRLIG
ncbi:acyl carrier protein, partial [Inquilinus sp. CA228]|uniref:acyl carrier protein n=1 Tax=Inquilinus sp. CA228 TaxID=3455609 RepID=UPI003F8D1FDA